jgi:predicted nucleic acid-binding protein
VIYLDSSAALARLLFQRRAPSLLFWDQRLVSSRLLEYEVWNRLYAYDTGRSNQEAGQALLMGIELFEMEQPVLARALEPWPVPIRTLDALHLATAEYLRQRGEAVELASYDNRLLTAAAALGIPAATL